MRLKSADWPASDFKPKASSEAARTSSSGSSKQLINIAKPSLLDLTKTPSPLRHRPYTLRRRSSPPLSAPPTLALHFAAMFKQLIPRASTRGALSSGFQSAQALRSTAPSTTLLQQRIWQRRGYATETGKGSVLALLRLMAGKLTFAQRRRTLLSSVAVLPAMSPPSRLARRASRYVQERGSIHI